ncbi:MAG: sigma-54 interaction domain-containing protein [Guyparkeria sp.]|uniref:sigma-54 interaction domain-containing protein n=1 Tax=Guyparkeria sp. TaxID=2035736 RepID=UPI00397D9526
MENQVRRTQVISGLDRERRLPMLSLHGREAVDEVRRIVEPFYWKVIGVEDQEQLARRLRRDPVKVVLVDLRDALSFFTGWLPAFSREHPSVQFVAIVEKRVAENSQHAAFLHAYFFDLCFAPIEPTRLTFSIGHAWTMARVAETHLSGETSPPKEGADGDRLIGRSEVMQKVRRKIRRFADNDLPVLITGPTGTGKELAARSIHERSSRQEGGFVAVNCGALNPSLVQSELFGHEKGAFTGAGKRHVGWVELADGGTLFLDEIGDLPPETQVSLLRFLQQGEIQRVGGEATIAVDARIIAATHVELAKAVADGRFREDLFFRLDVLPLEMPSLVERGADVIELAQYYLERFSRELGVKTKRLSPATEGAILNYGWPGNIRELMNRLRRGIVLSDGPTVSLPELESSVENDAGMRSLAEIRDEAERNAIAQAVSRSGHNITEAARMLDVSRCTLHRLIRKHRLPFA